MHWWVFASISMCLYRGDIYTSLYYCFFFIFILFAFLIIASIRNAQQAAVKACTAFPLFEKLHTETKRRDTPVNDVIWVVKKKKCSERFSHARVTKYVRLTSNLSDAFVKCKKAAVTNRASCERAHTMNNLVHLFWHTCTCVRI